ncbi:MAG: hypothetical protein A2622_09355 [Bdellovibrionales bacterium RIFCSPHIGHO2_01_FULL_40_29]|nr:MAG: hypothetical protein A2622_09355 [Bdellovibrionales bacterium RIFCSPHIGHO2_01_FULL_40_29]OFZ33569.1 MAG: hypothetical protein A3D17_00265 [Bdellovibrionales bacterium RIFCSPHIGHO2_02_FULL_40_15]
MTTPNEKFKVRARNIITGKVTEEMVTKQQIAEGLDGKDLNIEDIGIALLNDLRQQMGLELIEPVMDDDDDMDEPPPKQLKHRR